MRDDPKKKNVIIAITVYAFKELAKLLIFTIIDDLCKTLTEESLISFPSQFQLLLTFYNILHTLRLILVNEQCTF